MALTRRPSRIFSFTLVLLALLFPVGMASAQDTTPPVITITSPANGSAIIASDLEMVQGTAVDPESAIRNIRFMLWTNECDPDGHGYCYKLWRTTSTGGTEWYYTDELDYWNGTTDNGTPVWTSTGNLPLMEDMEDGKTYNIVVDVWTTANLYARAYTEYTYRDSAVDVVEPTITQIMSIEGDYSAPYVDPNNNGSSAVAFLSEDNHSGVASCRWSFTNVGFSSMANVCASTSSCIVAPVVPGPVTAYLACIDAAGNDSSTYPVSWTVSPDLTPPTFVGFTKVEADTTAPWEDLTDNGVTELYFVTTDNNSGVAACRWSTTDQAYASMPTTCNLTNNCVLNLRGYGVKTAYFRCIDRVGNAMTSSAVLNYTLGVPPPVVAPTIAITSPPNGAIVGRLPTSITGTSTGLSSVSLTYMNLANLQYWNGSKWTTSPSVLPARINANGAWVNAGLLPTSGKLGAKYMVTAKGLAANRSSTDVASLSIETDAAASPVASTTFTLNGRFVVFGASEGAPVTAPTRAIVH